MNIKQKAVKAALWSIVQGGGSQVSTLMVFFVLARLLKPSDFGLLALANIFFTFLQIFLHQGFTQSLIQRQKLSQIFINTAFWSNLLIGSILSIISFTTANLVADAFGQPQLTSILQYLSLLFIVVSFSTVQQALLERRLAFKALAIRSLVGNVLGGILGITLALKGFGVWSLIHQQVFTEFIGTFVLWKISDWRPQFQFSIQYLRELSHFGISILGFNILDFLNKRADDLLIGYYLGAVALGYYTIAYRILTVMTQILIGTSSQIALPTFSRLQNDLLLFRQAFYRATQLTSLITFPAFLGVFALAPELVKLLFGEKWLPSVPVMQVLALVGILRTVAYFKGSVFMALGKPSWRLWLGLIGTSLNLVGFSIGVHSGIVGVAIAYLICGCIVVPIGQWAIMKVLDIPIMIYFSYFVTPLTSSLIMTGAILLTKQFINDSFNSLTIIMLCTTIALFVYCLVIRLFAPNVWHKLSELVSLALSRQTSKTL